MKTYLWIAFGSALGGMARHALNAFVSTRNSSLFPWGTFVVNVTGSLAIGLIAALPEAQVPPVARTFLMVGVLGGFTTFSAFSLQTASLFNSGNPATALLYSISSTIACPLVAWLGWTAAHRP